MGIFGRAWTLAKVYAEKYFEFCWSLSEKILNKSASKSNIPIKEAKQELKEVQIETPAPVTPPCIGLENQEINPEEQPVVVKDKGEPTGINCSICEEVIFSRERIKEYNGQKTHKRCFKQLFRAVRDGQIGS